MSPRPSTQGPPAGLPGARRRRRRLAGVLGLLVAGAAATGIFMATSASSVPPAQPVLASSTQFDFTGIIQKATLDTPGDAHSGGQLLVNGKTIIIPKETVVILPASALTWQELWKEAPAPYGLAANGGNGDSGLALEDATKPLTSYEVSVTGNRVVDPGPDANGNITNGCTQAAGCDRYIAGMVHISQEDLNSASGYINYIDYTTGEMRVGGTLGDPTTGARVAINDPEVGNTGSGRFGRTSLFDKRFQVDQDNPTIAAETGFPMCVPRWDPNDPGATGHASDDPKCPEVNRPRVSSPVTDQSGITPQPNTLVANEAYRLFRMDDPANIPDPTDPNKANVTGANCLIPNACRDPRIQAPFEVGDYVTYSGNVEQDGTGKFTAAHTIIASLGIYTQPGVDPAYTSIEVSLVGTGGLTVFGAGEAAVRTRFEGMTTDETRQVHVYGIDINPVTGATTDRDWGTIMPDPGPPNGAVRGRWRLRPPCTGAVATQKVCTPPPGGSYIPPTRELRAVIEGLQSQDPANPGAQTAANGIFYGQYHAPIGEYIFPENVPGTAVPENNFNTIPFLAYGGYTSADGTQVGQLSPWPSSVVPAAAVAPVASLQGAPWQVANGGTVKLSGSVNADATSPVSIKWTAGTTAGGTDLNANLANATTTTPTFNAAGLAAGTYYVKMTATNLFGSDSAGSTVVVAAAPAPTINPIQNVSVGAGTTVNLTATTTSTPLPTWAWAEAAGPAAVPFTQAPSAATPIASSSISFTPQTAGTYTFTVQATNANGTSATSSITVTVSANLPTDVTLQTEYRTSKQRLIVTGTSTNVNISGMTLQPYMTENGTMFDPATLGANLTASLVAPGSYTITAVGAPRPACNLGGTYGTPCAQRPLQVKSYSGSPANVVGISPMTDVQRIRN